MEIKKLEQRISELRSRPLLLVCRDTNGREKVMTPEECRRTGSTYIHVAADDLDKLLSAELGETVGPDLDTYSLDDSIK